MLLNHALSRPKGPQFLGCAIGDIVWLILFTGIGPLASLSWYFYLRLTYHKHLSKGISSQFILYSRKFVVYPILRLLPGLFQSLITIFFTFLFVYQYTTSAKSALRVVVSYAVALWLSRILCIYYSQSLMARDPKVLARCEDGYFLGVRRPVLELRLGTI